MYTLCQSSFPKFGKFWPFLGNLVKGLYGRNKYLFLPEYEKIIKLKKTMEKMVKKL